MKSVSLELPDNLATVLNSYVQAGFFRSEIDVILAAATEFVRRNRIDLIERFAHEDIEWAKNGIRNHK